MDSCSTPPLLPLCVDLDGTLIKTDSLHEQLFVIFRKQPLKLLSLVWQLRKGKARFKERVSDLVNLEGMSLPYNQNFLDYLKGEKQKGRTLVLATAADRRVAEEVARRVDIFSEVFGSGQGCNLSGSQKAEALAKRFPDGFAYAGDALVDLSIFKRAGQSILVNPSRALLYRKAQIPHLAQIFASPKSQWLSFIKAIRIHQWIKNILVFTPALLAHNWNSWVWFDTIVSFFAFCLTASSVYLLNDLVDLEADRNHKTKKNRPFASGDLKISHGLVGIPVLLGFGLLLAASLNSLSLLMIVIYLVMTTLYSLWLKQKPLLDVIILAVLYTWRIFLGGAATGLHLSAWLFGFSVFFFFSLAVVKRAAEIIDHQGDGPIKSRNYFKSDLPVLISLGCSSGVLSVVVLALYINGMNLPNNYSHPDRLWPICVLLLFWISRIWLITGRNQMYHDPIVFSVKDRVSYVIGLLILIFGFAAL